jgi:hypothetical protein
VTNPIGKEARDEVCRTRLGVSEGAVVRTRSRRRVEIERAPLQSEEIDARLAAA